MEYLFSFPTPPWIGAELHYTLSLVNIIFHMTLGVCGGILHILLNIETIMVLAGAPMLHRKNNLV